MLLDLFNGGFTKEAIISVLLSIPVILLALTIHECSHGLAAKLMGDPTAYNLGRLTLNPAKHLDPMGTLMMMLFGFGWAKPVPVNSRYFKKPKVGMIITSVAGPLSNLIAGYIFYLVSFLIYRFYLVPTGAAYILMFDVNGGTLDYLMITLYLLFYIGYAMNIGLALFNLLPIPPLDGSRILFSVLPARMYFGMMKYERYISLVLMILLFTGILSRPLGIVMNGIERLFELSVLWMV